MLMLRCLIRTFFGYVNMKTSLSQPNKQFSVYTLEHSILWPINIKKKLIYQILYIMKTSHQEYTYIEHVSVEC